MERLNLNAILMWPLLGALVLILMSFQDPFRVALAALLIAAQGPTWRFIQSFDRPAVHVRISR